MVGGSGNGSNSSNSNGFNPLTPRVKPWVIKSSNF